MARVGLARRVELRRRTANDNIFGEIQKETPYAPQRDGHSFPGSPRHAKNLAADRSESHRASEIGLRTFGFQALAAVRRIAIFPVR